MLQPSLLMLRCTLQPERRGLNVIAHTIFTPSLAFDFLISGMGPEVALQPPPEPMGCIFFLAAPLAFSRAI